MSILLLGQQKQHLEHFIFYQSGFHVYSGGGGDTLSGCDTQFVNNDTSQDTQFVSMEGSSSKDTQSVQSEIQNMKKNMSAMLSVVQPKGEDLLNNSDKSEDKDDNWDLLDDIEDLKDDDEKGLPVKDNIS